LFSSLNQSFSSHGCRHGCLTADYYAGGRKSELFSGASTALTGGNRTLSGKSWGS